MVTPAARRKVVAHAVEVHGVSERRACRALQVDRSSHRYQSRRPDDGALRERLRPLAQARRRFGYRRIFILLRREGEPSGRNRIYRLYREEGLSVRKRRARRRAVGTRAPILIEARANARWSVDFVHDQMTSGRRFRIFNVVDDVTRECLASIADTSISGARVARELTALIERRGKPGMIVSDHGTEFTSNAVLAWSATCGITWHYIALGKPMQNALVERKAGLEEVTPHTLRQTAAVWMAEAGVPMSEIAQYLAHTPTRVTEKVYARYSPDYLRKAAGALKMRPGGEGDGGRCRD